MRPIAIAAALLGIAGLAAPATAAYPGGLRAPAAMAADVPTTGLVDVAFSLRQFVPVPPSFALLGCDMDQDGPEVSFLQLAGSGNGLGSGSSFTVEDAQGLPCAEVLSELLRAGFVIQDSRLVVLRADNVVVYDLVVAP